MNRNVIQKLGLIVAIALSGCASTQPDPASRPASITLGDLISTGSTNNRPSGSYYVALTASPDNGVRIQDQQCIDKSFWSFARRYIGINKSAAAMLTAKITPINDPAQAITVPIFLTSANEVSSSGVGSDCQTKFWARPITFTFNSNLNPAFNVDLEFHLTDSLNSTAIKNLVNDAQALMTLVGTASGTPAAFAAKLADPQITALASRIDAQIQNNWTSTSDLQITKQLASGGNNNASVDLITFKMPTINSEVGGPSLGTWDAGGTISLIYSKEKFKSSGMWVDRDTVLIMPIVPSVAPGSQTTLDKIVLNGDVTNGFDKLSLINASNNESLSNACSHLKRFLSGFLIPDDALVARYALLKESSYDKNPNLREQSGCLTDDEQALLITMRKDFTFSEQPREDRDNSAINNKMKPILSALLSRNPTLIGTIIGDPDGKFYVVLGKEKTDYLVGKDAVAKLSDVQMKLVCYQARSDHDLSSIAAVAIFGGHKTGAIVSFDGQDKLSSITLMPPENVADSLGVDRQLWLDPKKDSCTVDGSIG
jgi:hypothetical protein